MPKEPSIGRARVGRTPQGRARVGRAVGKAPLPENARTDVIRVDAAAPQPVFVDPTGGRRRWLRRTAYAIGILLILALITIWVTQLGEPARPPARPSPSAR
ncbi:hypothetical protein [Actinoplanes sp. URMC 104]|uniref:hypothetical protein n=1 Tax=Actinoplanes sp. URMC 104 TaxID=3423409 RepID=UPI003F1C0DD2